MTTSLPSDTASSTPTAHASAGDDNQLITERREKLAGLRAKARDAGTAVFPNDFKPRHHAAELNRLHGALDNETLEPQNITVALAGRLMLKRVMGRPASARCKTAPAASSCSSPRTRWAKTSTPSSSTGTWATSWAPKARCSRPKPVSSRCASRRCAC
jgi:lysyl-tRNA synthetase class 2